MMYVSDWTLKYDEPEVENDTRSTVTRWSFDNDKPHVTAFRPISETANSWSYDNKQWRHSWSTTPTQIPALWLAATSCATSQKNEHVYFWLQSHCSCITVALWTTLNCPRYISLPSSSSRSRRGPSRLCTTMSTVDSTPPEVSSRNCGREGVGRDGKGGRNGSEGAERAERIGKGEIGLDLDVCPGIP